jgi:hypothetical protein
MRCNGRGKQIRREFLPIAVDRAHQMRQASVITKEMRMAFAAEAVEVHFARCAAVAEYTLLNALSATPPGRRLRPWMAAGAVMVAALLTGYGLWQTWSVAEVEPRPARWTASPASGQLQSVPASPVMDTPQTCRCVHCTARWPRAPLRSRPSPQATGPVGFCSTENHHRSAVAPRTWRLKATVHPYPWYPLWVGQPLSAYHPTAVKGHAAWPPRGLRLSVEDLKGEPDEGSQAWASGIPNVWHTAGPRSWKASSAAADWSAAVLNSVQP